MSATEIMHSRPQHPRPDTGHDDDFGRLAERHRRELQVHCYRMLGSLEESEDLVQETFLRAWRRRESFEGRSSMRAWLYKIATNACLDALRSRPRRPEPSGEVLWLQPFPDRLLEEVEDPDAGPAEAVAAKETLELAYIVAVQHLPPRQRAVLILRDVVGWSARETASLLDSSVASANSALQRARAAMEEHLPDRRAEWAAGVDASDQERELVKRYVEATERADTEAFVDMLRAEARFWMPPRPGLWEGADAVVQSWVDGGFGGEEFGDMRCRVTRANRQPAVACYVRKPGWGQHRALALDVLRIEEGRVAEIVTFDEGLFAAFGLPERLPDQNAA